MTAISRWQQGIALITMNCSWQQISTVVWSAQSRWCDALWAQTPNSWPDVIVDNDGIIGINQSYPHSRMTSWFNY